MTTIRDVARLAGVAPITVSRVLNNSGYVKPETRARVERAAAELHYVPNMLAHSFRSNRTNTLALVLTDITNPFWTTVARGVEDVASTEGYSVFFCNTDENEAKQTQYLAALLRRRVDGVLLVPVTSSGDAVRTLQRQQVDVVVLDRRVDDVEVDTVRGDSFTGAHELVCHLTALGHRAIAFLSGPSDLSVSRERAAGYEHALKASGLIVDPSLMRSGAFTVESGAAMMADILAERPDVTAIFAANNFIAAGALRVLQAAGRRVPDDMSVVVFDDLPGVFAADPWLTVAAQPAYELGRTATQRLLQRIGAPAPLPCEDIVLPGRIIVRNSTRAPRLGDWPAEQVRRDVPVA